MIEKFFTTATTNAARLTEGRSIYECRSNPIMLLSGPASCGKTSLLFQYALNCAAERQGEGYVVFICSRRRLEAKPPFLSQGTDYSSDLFHQVRIKYVDDDYDIKKYFAAFHLLHPSPVAVIVDDFGDFFHERRKCQERDGNPRGRDLDMVRLLAICRSAILHANKATSCQLLLSDTHHGATPRLLFIYKRWMSSIFIIEAQQPGSFLLKNTDYVKSTVTAKWTARYSIALQYLVLEEFAEDVLSKDLRNKENEEAENSYWHECD